MAANKKHAEPQMWSEEDLSVLREIYSSTSIHDLVKRFNRTSTSINKAASRYGLKKSDEWKNKEFNRHAIRDKLRNMNRAFCIEEFPAEDQKALKAMAHQGEIKRKGYAIVPGIADPVRMYVASSEMLTAKKEIVYTWHDILTEFMNEMWPLPFAWGTARIIKQSM